jgi:beta-lactamase superfamily II metal-dependent hydrolase
MANKLEIHHIDVGQGDSTLILVRNEANNAVVKSALIDGGLLNQVGVVHPYLMAKGVTRLDVMVATHYDKDHFYGLRGLLEKNDAIYANVRIYDRGEEGAVDQFGKVSRRENDFQLYVNAAGGGDPREPSKAATRAGRSRPTAWVNQAAEGTVVGANTWQGGGKLVGQELFQLGGSNPKMTCIAANQFVSSNPKKLTTSSFVFGGLGIDDNPSSVGFLIEYGNFRYYTAGDLEKLQEEAVAKTLNPTDSDHVCAFKLSHHGSEGSTSEAFLKRLRARAAFVSCGDLNGFGHPKPSVLTLLEEAKTKGAMTLQNYYLTSCGGAQSRLNLPGCIGVKQTKPLPGTTSRVAGGTNQPGHIVLTVTSANAAATPHAFSVVYWDWDKNKGAGGDETVNHTC